MSDESDSDAAPGERVTADDLLETDDVEHFRESQNHSHAADAVLTDFAERVRSADETRKEVELTAAVTDALQTIADESDDPVGVRELAQDKTGNLAPKSGKTKDELLGIVDDATRPIVEQDRKERVESGDVLTVPEGIGLDRYLEDKLEEIVRQKSTDAVDDPIFRWRFSDGVRIETSESIHHDYYALFKKLAGATEHRLVPEVASEQAEGELLEEEEVEGEAYARLSLGDESRPWSTEESYLWSRAISGLVEERIRTESIVGPRTDAWESIQASVRSGRAVRDLTDAVEHGMIHVDEANNEVWLPTMIVDNAADKIETSRRAIQAELAERGVTSSALSGERVSEAVSRGGTALRFWRLDLDHDDVPTPETVLDEVADPTALDVTGDDGTAGAAATTDGGTQTEHGAETFGRSPDRAETEPPDESTENGGDREPDGTDSEGGSSETDGTDSADSDDDPPPASDDGTDGGDSE
jgi:hypothetical protein